jgi:hypothetical protein
MSETAIGYTALNTALRRAMLADRAASLLAGRVAEMTTALVRRR